MCCYRKIISLDSISNSVSHWVVSHHPVVDYYPVTACHFAAMNKRFIVKSDVSMFQNSKILHRERKPKENPHEGVWPIHWDHRTWTGNITHLQSVPPFIHNPHCKIIFIKKLLFLGKKIWHHPNADSHRLRSGNFRSGKSHRQTSWPEALLNHTTHFTSTLPNAYKPNVRHISTTP